MTLNDPLLFAVALVPLLPLLVVTLSLWIHLLVFLWGCITPNYIYMSKWGALFLIALGLTLLTGVVANYLPGPLVDRILEYPDDAQWTWAILATLMTIVAAVVVKLAIHHLGRVIYINAGTGKARFYSVARTIPWSQSTYVDDEVELGLFDGSVDVWGLGTLHPLRNESRSIHGASSQVTVGDISEKGIEKMVRRTNAWVEEKKKRERNDLSSRSTIE